MPHVDTIVDGEKLPSVTQIVGVLDKPFLYKWYAKHGWDACEKMKEDSAQRGRAFHENVEKILKSFLVYHTCEEVLPDEYCEAVLRWCEVTGFQPVQFEEHVISRLHKYGGTFDCVGMMPKERLTLVDWKLTGQISEVYSLQASGYYQGYKEKTGKEIQEARIIRPYELKRKATEDSIEEMANGWRYSFKGLSVRIEERIYTNLEHYFSVFLGLRQAYDFIHKKGMWEK